MPPIPVPYTPRPFVGDRYEPHDRTPEYMRQSTRDEVEMMRRQGERSAQMWSGIGQEISGTLRDIAAYPDVIRQRQMAAQKLQDEQDQAARARWEFDQKKKLMAQQESDTQTLNALIAKYGGRPPADEIARTFGALRGAQIDKGLDEIFGSPKDAAKRGEDVVKAIGGYGNLSNLSDRDVEDVLQSPYAGQVRYSFGPGMANGPEVMPNRAQQDAIDLKNAVQAKGGFVQPNGTINWGPPKPAVPKEPEIGSFSDYVTRKYGPRPTPAQIESARRTWEDTGRAPQASAPVDTSAADALAANPGTQSLLAQTGLSLPGFFMLTGQPSAVPRDSRTRTQAMNDAQKFANNRGVDMGTFVSQYKAFNGVLQKNIERFNAVQIAESELAGTLDNLGDAARENGLSDVRAYNAMKLWVKGELNNPDVQKYAFHLNQLRSELAYYNAAVSGRSGNVLQADMAEADRLIKNGIESGSIVGLQTALKRSVEKMGTSLQGSVDRASRDVWNLFGVGDKYTPKGVVKKPKTNPNR